MIKRFKHVIEESLNSFFLRKIRRKVKVAIGSRTVEKVVKILVVSVSY